MAEFPGKNAAWERVFMGGVFGWRRGRLTLGCNQQKVAQLCAINA
ncbi:hypothetical protein [Massilia sp. TWR1-2-2]